METYYHFIVNPNSKNGRGAKVWKLVENELKKQEITYQLHMTEKSGDVVLIVRQLCLQLKEMLQEDNVSPGFTLIVLGGDGTLNEMVCGLDLDLCEYIRIGYIPTGSGNDFCRSMHLPKDPLAALHQILTSEQSSLVDVGEVTCTYESLEAACAGGAKEQDGLLKQAEGEVDAHMSFGHGTDKVDAHMSFGHGADKVDARHGAVGRYQRTRRFLVSCGCGYDAAVCHQLLQSGIKPLLNRLHMGKLCYLASGIYQIWALQPFQVNMLLWNKVRRRRSGIAFCSMHIQPYEGGGFCFAPTADAQDGRLDVCTVFVANRWNFTKILIASIFKLHPFCQGVTLSRTGKVSLVLEAGQAGTGRNAAAHADGESLGRPQVMEVSCHQKKLQVITAA